MILRSQALLALLAILALSGHLAAAPAQVAGKPPGSVSTPAPQSAPATPPIPSSRRQPPKPAAAAAPGGGPDKVWVNLNSGTYHCFGDRYYGRTAHGRYLTEPAAKAAGAHGPKGKPCSAAK